MGSSRWKKNIVAVISQDRVIDDKFKRQIKNLLKQIFQYTSNCSKVFEYLPTLFLQYTQSNNFSKFFKKNNFSVDCTVLHTN